MGGLEPLAESLGGVGGRRPWTASRRRASHAACGMMAAGAASLGSAGVRMRISSKVCTICTPSRLFAFLAHFTQRQSSCKAGADHQARWEGARGGEGSVPGVLERRGEDVDLRWGWGWRCLGARERRWRGLGVEDGYGRRKEREGEVDMGRRWRACWRLGEREWWWRGLGVVDGYGRQGGTRSPAGPVGGGGGGHGAAVACLAALGGAGAVVAGAGGGGRVRPEGGGQGGHGAAVALVVAPGGAGAAGGGPWGVVVVPGAERAVQVGD